MKDLRLRPGARKVRAMVAEGEHQSQDFKFAISDPRKIARSISAFANRDGGRLLIGVKDNGVIAGVRNDEDIYVVETAAQSFCRPAQEVTFEGYSIDTGIHVIVATVPKASRLPVYVRETSGLKAYWRCADENIVAPDILVDAWEIAASPMAASLGGVHAAILGIIGDDGIEADALAVALRLHLPVDAVRRAISELLALSSLGLHRTGSRFLLHHTPLP